MKLKKGSKEAKAFMAKIRAAKGKPKKKLSGWNNGGTYVIESGEKKPLKAKKVILVTRRKVVKPGTFKKFSRVGSTQHKDTKSHNVNIRVLSGINKMKKYDYNQLENINLTRVNNDVNGNPRYVLHFYDILNKEERAFLPFSKKYEYALKKAKIIGGKKFHNKQYGGGIVFQSYNTDNLKENIIDVLETTPKIKY